MLSAQEDTDNVEGGDMSDLSEVDCRIAWINGDAAAFCAPRTGPDLESTSAGKTNNGSSVRPPLILRSPATPKWCDKKVLEIALLASLSVVSGSAGAQEQAPEPSGNLRPTPSAARSIAGDGTTAAKAWRLEPYVNVRETFTDNVSLAPSGGAKSDLISEITPGIRINGKGRRTSLNGFVASPIVVYARSGSENNQVYPSANILGNLEAIDSFLYVEAAASATPQFFSPFGSQSGNLSNVNQNRYTSTSYSVNPYIQGTMPGNISYLLRNNNTWTKQSDTSIETDDSYHNQWLGNVSSPVAPLGWAIDVDRTEVRFKSRDSELTQLARARLEYRVSPQVQVMMSGGYEDNRYSDSNYSGSIYGVGLQWRPTERTSVDAKWEHRFFGSSYSLGADHRTPLSVWNVRVSRNITSYPEQVVALPVGGNIQGLLNQAFLSRISDPVQRQAAVDRFIQERNLPTALSSPVNIYTQQITLVNYQSATFGLLAVRNTIFFTVYNSKSVPISGSGSPLPPGLTFSNDNTQRGASVTWTHKLTPLTNLNATAQTSKTFTNGSHADKATQSELRVMINSPLTAKASLYGGARYQVYRFDGTSDYDEAAIFAGLNYVFR